MCGIVGYVGPKAPLDVLMPGLERLEYRGYDSAGIALNTGSDIEIVKRAGRIAELAERWTGRITPMRCRASATPAGRHTARPTTRNAHPHLGCDGSVTLVHNGIVENWAELKSGCSNGATRSPRTPTPRWSPISSRSGHRWIWATQSAR
jgi:glutamine---fructose-6-phosphate transaminase (isomerizing)